MQTVTNKLKLQFDENSNPELVIGITKADLPDVAELKQVLFNGKLLSLEIKQHRLKRSLDANSYLWIICQKIAEKLGSTKELVYQQKIKEVGQFEIVPIKAEAVERWLQVWKGKGTGWFAEVMEDSKLTGYKKVISYYGSSIYDTREMSILIDETVTQAKELGIDTMTPGEINLLKQDWGR